MITRIFDQTTNGNHLHVIGEPSGLEPVGTGGRLHAGTPITGTNASADPLFVDGHAVYSAYFEGGMGFRNQDTTGVPTGDEPETLYMVTSGQHYGGACCFDYGNAEARHHVTFRLNFHRFFRIALDLRGHTNVRGAAFSCLRLKLADLVLI